MAEADDLDPAMLRRHAGFGRLIAYVAEKRRERQWAARADIDPCDLAGLLPHLWLIEVGTAQPRLLVRLAGTRIETVYGRSLTGRYLEELDWGPNSAQIFASLNRMADTGAAHFLDAAAQIRPRLSRRVQRLGLPLSDDQQRISHLLLLAYYEFTSGAAAGTRDHFREMWLSPDQLAVPSAADTAGRKADGTLHEGT
ncbi:MAG: PAS domain-containing protein [Rhodospirillaceae bacterium]|nr:PAS domain-containing protein [Rhodospirillaceae bacterium]